MKQLFQIGGFRRIENKTFRIKFKRKNSPWEYGVYICAGQILFTTSFLCFLHSLLGHIYDRHVALCERRISADEEHITFVTNANRFRWSRQSCSIITASVTENLATISTVMLKQKRFLLLSNQIFKIKTSHKLKLINYSVSTSVLETLLLVFT